MKIYTLLLFVSMSMTNIVTAQDIFEQCGFDKEALTLSGGRYNEFFDNEEIVQIGTTLLNTKTNKIVAFIDQSDSKENYQSEFSSRWLSVDPLAAKYPQFSPYTYCANNPVIYVDPDGQKIKLANNFTGGMTNIAQIAATGLGNQVMSQLIAKNETYPMNGTFWSSSSSYNPENRKINYVSNPWYDEIPRDGGALTSTTAMAHESMHAFDHSNNSFNSENAGARKGTLEPRAVSFANYIRDAYSLSPSRKQYGSIEGNFNQFSTNEKISNFTTLGSNSNETSYGFSYTKSTTTVESYTTFGGFQVPNETSTTSATYYMTVNRDKDNNVTYQIYDNIDDYNNATSNW